MATDGNIVTRAPNFTITGRRGASLTVSSTSVTSYDTSATFGVGQKLTRVSSGNFQWETLGMNRSAALPSGREIFDISTKTADGAPLVVTGTSRGNRKIVSGTLEIYHNLAQYKSSVAFDNLQYSPACNEPVSGTVTGTVTGSKSGVFTMTFTDCGTATVSYREGSKDPVTTNSESDTSTAL